MYNLLIALGLGLLAFGAAAWGFDGMLYGIFPGLLVAMGAYVYLAKRSMDSVQAVMLSAQDHLQKTAQNNRDPKAAQLQMKKAVQILETARVHQKWQFLVKPQIDGQVGQLYFMSEKFNKSRPFLTNAFKKHWTARAMLAVVHYKRKEYEDMETVFDEAAEANKKESLLWNIYAYCMLKIGKRNEAAKILSRALEHVPNDEKTKTNLHALQNNKKMKMRGWNMMWYQFHLEKPPPQRQHAQFRRR